MKKTLKRLRAMPNEPGFKVSVIGTKLNNAFGREISVDAIERGYQEIILIIVDKDNNQWDTFNLATLIALAKKAKL